MTIINHDKPVRWTAADATALNLIVVSEVERGYKALKLDDSSLWTAKGSGVGAAIWRLADSSFRDGVTVVTLTDAATIAWDMSHGSIYQVTLAGNRTLGLATNGVIGKSYYLKVIQDATGSRTLAYNAAYHAAGGAITITVTAAHWDWLKVTCLAANVFLVEQVADVSALA